MAVSGHIWLRHRDWLQRKIVTSEEQAGSRQNSARSVRIFSDRQMRSYFGMSRIFPIVVLFCIVFGPVAGIQAVTHHGGARLIVQRAPNFGNDLAVQLSIDDRKVANIPRDQHYDGALSSGHHLLSVLALPNTEQRRPTSVSVTVRSGRTYIFTAGWDSNRLVLRRSTTYVPTTAVPPVR